MTPRSPSTAKERALDTTGMVKTQHGWARPCAVCGSTNFGKPCAKTEDGFHV